MKGVVIIFYLLFWLANTIGSKSLSLSSLELLGSVRVCVFSLPHFDSIQIWYLDQAVYCMIALHMTSSHLWCVVLAQYKGDVFERDQNKTFHFLFYSSWTLLKLNNDGSNNNTLNPWFEAPSKSNLVSGANSELVPKKGGGG